MNESSRRQNGPFRVGDRVQLTGPKGRLNTVTLEQGGEFDTTSGSHAKWSVEIESSTVADVYKVAFTCEISDSTRTAPEKRTETFMLLRPTWVIDPGERGKLKEDAKTRIMELQGKLNQAQQVQSPSTPPSGQPPAQPMPQPASPPMSLLERSGPGAVTRTSCRTSEAETPYPSTGGPDAAL